DSVSDETTYPPLEWRQRIETWFVAESCKRLGQLAFAIQSVELRPPLRDFVLLAFSRAVRRSSLARQGELKLWRRSDEPTWEDPVSTFNLEAIKLLRDLVSLHSQAPIAKQFKPVVINDDAESAVAGIRDANLVLTSPPYGD